jgi:hypothetical protein
LQESQGPSGAGRGAVRRCLAGNTIDFFVQVLGLSFHHAMREITGD